MPKDTLFHDFFHNPTARGEYSGVNVSFRDVRFFSYATVIGQKMWPNKKKDPYLLISSSTMSPTTSRHLDALRRACPYQPDHVIAVPFKFGTGYAYRVKEIKELFEGQIAAYVKNADCLERQANRYEAHCLLTNYNKFRSAFRIRHFKLSIKLANLISAIVEKRKRPVDPVKAEKRRQARLRRHEQVMAGVKDWTYMDKVKFLHARGFPFITGTERKNLVCAIQDLSLPSQVRNSNGTWSRTSYVWIAGGQVVTSQNVRLPIPIVKRAIATWRSKGAMAVGRVGAYQLDEATEDYMKIGCHYIPMDNIIALEKELEAMAQ